MSDLHVLHATMGEKHLYKFLGQTLSAIGNLRVNGEPIDLSLAVRDDPYVYTRFLGFEEAMVTLETVTLRDEGHYERNDLENPFKFDLPDSFSCREEMVSFAEANDLIRDLGGEIVSVQVAAFYEWVKEMVEKRSPVEFEVREIGEIVPCPSVSFPWTAVQPFDVGVPMEMWHLGPCQVTKDTILSRFWAWVRDNKKVLCIDSMFPDQKGGHVYFKIDGVSAGMIGVTEHPSFAPLIGAIQAPNLTELAILFDERMSLLCKLMADASPTHLCPRCNGDGALPCPRCAGTGQADLGPMAEQALKNLRESVRNLQYAKGKDKVEEVDRAMRFIDGLRKYILPE